MLEIPGTQSSLIQPEDWVNRFRDRLASGRFAINFEIVTPRADRPLDEAMRPFAEFALALAKDDRAAAIAVADRVKSDDDQDAVQAAAWLTARTGLQPLVHWAGKDRTLPDLDRSLREVNAAGLANVLFLTGDRADRDSGGREVEYLDSVNSVFHARRQAPELFSGAVVSCFKYREEELFNQYYKLSKKIRAGAQFIIGQIGVDVAKHAELIRFMKDRGLRVPLLAGVFSPSPRAALWIKSGGAPGVSLTDDMVELIQQESEQPDGGKGARLRRLALQIVGLELLGYAGVQITGIHHLTAAARLLDLVDELRLALHKYEGWIEAWREALRLKDGRTAQTAPQQGFYLETSQPEAQSTPQKQVKFHFLDTLDRLLFQEHAPAAPAMRLLSGARLPIVDRALLGIERATKEPLVGCRTCGFCRLPYTQYVCPETCPKGLANGPCGGTNGNRCEFGDRECIHNERYRLARARNALFELDQAVIPPVPGTRGTCSWTNHFRGAEPNVTQLDGQP